MMTLVSAIIAAGLYSNIGIKVLYNNIIFDFFKVPITSRAGRIMYAILVPIWWAIAYVIGAAIPDFFGLVSIISAFALLPMTYTLPALFALGYDIQRYAMRPHLGEGFDPTTGTIVRHGGTLQRWTRGFFSGGAVQVTVNSWHVLYVFGTLVTCGLGMYSSITRKFFFFFFFFSPVSYVDGN